MSVATELQTLQTNIGNAYTTIGTKGGTVPANKNTDNLATAIDSIPSGGTPQPLDPQVVYQQTRPADWLEMPTPGTDEIYMLLQIPSDCIDDQDFSMSITGNNEKTVSFGTVSSGTFVPDPDLVYTQAGANFSIQIPVNKFGDLTSDDMLQLMCKISGTAMTTIGISAGSVIHTRIREFKGGNMTNFTGVAPGSSSFRWSNLNYFSLGQNKITSCNQMFSQCANLIAVMNLELSLVTNASNMFSSCSNLVAIPQLNTSSVTNFSGMFTYCRKLEAIPLINTESGTNFSYMFSSCSSLKTIPQLDTSKGTNFKEMFGSCSNLISIPLIDTGKGTDFSQMFNTCQALEEIPAIDTSEGTNFGSMFTYCPKLTSIPLLNTGKGTSFSSMFNGCAALTSIPLLNTSQGTNFTSMFNSCSSLSNIPNLDTSNGTIFTSMFQNCIALTKLPQINTSKSTNCNQMFSNDYAIGYYDLSIYDFSKVTSTSGLSSLISPMGGETVRFNPTLDQNKIYNTQSILQGTGSYTSASNPAKIIFPQNSMVQIVANATTLFQGNAYIYVYVPDDLYSDYQADAKWATLGNRLKKISEW